MEDAVANTKKLNIVRRNTKEGIHPREMIEWEYRDVVIEDMSTGKEVFRQDGVEVPVHWSDRALKVVVQKYFYGKVGTDQRESSVHELIERVTKTFADWGLESGYFADKKEAEAYQHELYYIIVHQKAAWNSPVWFNFGVPGREPQGHACVLGSDRVMTDVGFLQIKDVVDKKRGSIVQTFEGDAKIQERLNNRQKKVKTITLSNGQQINLTSDHRLWVADTAKGKGNRLTDVAEIEEGHYLQMRVEDLWRSASTDPSTEDVARAFLSGWFNGDGNYSKGTSHIMEMCSVDDVEREELDANLMNAFGMEFKKYKPSKLIEGYMRCRSHGDHVVEFLNAYGLIEDGSRTLRTPEQIYQGGQASVRAYLKALFTADGSVSIRHDGRPRIRFVTISESLAREAQELLSTLGIYSRLENRKDSRANRKDTWVVAISYHSELEKYKKLIGFASTKKNSLLNAGLMVTEGRNVASHKFQRVVNVSEEWQPEDDVYDIQTEAEEFLVGNIRVHNCHIMSVKDTLHGPGSIMQQVVDEAYIFSLGSGIGTNVSSLRSSEEHIKGGGKASGPISFMKMYDSAAGVVQSGGKTRRAAVMRTIIDTHPDVYHGKQIDINKKGRDFITIKSHAEKMAHVLVDAGYGGSMNCPAYESVPMQNANLSVRASDDFMNAVKGGEKWATRYVHENAGEICREFPAEEMMDEICKGTWVCGDPGLQFDSTIQRWHTCKEDGRIESSNPCVTADTLVSTKNGYKRIDSMLEDSHEIICGDGEVRTVKPAFITGERPVYRIRTQSGYQLKATAEHLIRTKNRGDVRAIDLLKDDKIELKGSGFGNVLIDGRMAELIGIVAGDGCVTSDRAIQVTLGNNEKEIADYLASNITDLKRESSDDGRSGKAITANKPQTTWRFRTSMPEIVNELTHYVVADCGSENKAFTQNFWDLNKGSQAQILAGLFTADGCVVDSGDKVQYVGLDSTSSKMLEQVQLSLLSFGIKSKIYRDRRAIDSTTAMLPDGKGGMKEYPVKQMHSLRITRSSRIVFEKEIGFMQCSEKSEKLTALNNRVDAYQDKFEDRISSVELVGIETVYDLTEPATEHFVANGIVVHNCSEYLFLDDTSCNLCSMNLMKYWSLEIGFDIDSFEHDVSLMFIACDIMNDFAWLANDELAKGVKNYRTIGLGYCNLGALILSHGYSYDSHKARLLMGTITSLMTAICYKTSTELAEHLEPFPRFGRNRESFIDVMKKHSTSHYKLEKTEGYEEVHRRAGRLWDLVVDRSQKYGARNAQATVLAPTGTISFMMDSDTTGCEPVLSHVTYKNLDGGGTIMIALNTFKNALKAMGYKGEEYDAIVKHMEAYGTLETVKLPKDCTTVAEYDAKTATDDYVCPPEKQWTERVCPFLKPDQLKVFDTSFPARLGKRSIHHNGHILALAAVQPFISGGMSKTINMPESATVQDIRSAYMLAWEKGVKCVAIYRDNCKRIQPATTKKAFTEEKKFDRAELPDEPLPADRHKFRVGDLKGYIHVTCYPNTNTPAEIFIKAARQGELISTMLDIIGQLISYHLQVPGKANVHLRQVTKILIGTHSKPSGFTGKSWCKQATSIFDYIGKLLKHHYDTEEDLDAVQKAFVDEAQHRGLVMNETVKYASVKDCPMCSTPMRFLGGTCHQCPNCTYSDGGCSA